MESNGEKKWGDSFFVQCVYLRGWRVDDADPQNSWLMSLLCSETATIWYVKSSMVVRKKTCFIKTSLANIIHDIELFGYGKQTCWAILLTVWINSDSARNGFLLQLFFLQQPVKVSQAQVYRQNKVHLLLGEFLLSFFNLCKVLKSKLKRGSEVKPSFKC